MQLISENSCSILTETTSQVNFKIYFDLKSDQVDNANGGDIIWKVGLSNGSLQQKRFKYTNTDGSLGNLCRNQNL